MTELAHPQRSPITDAAFRYIEDNNWTIVAVGLNKKPLGEWGPGAPNRYDYTNVERAYQINAPGLGVITGPSGLVIIDLDNDLAIRAWAKEFGTPTTRIAKTPRGRHLYYTAPLGIHIPPGTEILPGVDVRGGESYAILPPSNLANGAYQWLNNNEIEQLPDAVTHLIKQHKPERKKKILSGAPFDEGGRNDHIFTMACMMRSGGFDHPSILAAMLETNKRRCVPPLDIDEVESIVESAASYEEGAQTGIELITQLRARAATRDADDAPVLNDHVRLLNTQHLVNEEPEPIDWIWEDFLAPGTLNMLHGEGGLGKSFIALKIAEQLLADQPGSVFGRKTSSGGVVILDGENAEVQLHRRIQHTSIRPDANLNVYIVTDVLLGLEEQTEAFFDHIDEQHDPRLIIIDSQRALWAGDEKEQGEAGRMLRRFARYIEEKKWCGLLIHHDNRGGDYSGSSDINAAITGCRIHLRRHTDKDKPNARILTQPKNRIAAEVARQEFLLEIEQMPRSHRHDISGIKITPYTSDDTAQRAHRLEQAATLALNDKTNGAPFKNIWVATGIEFDDDGPTSSDRQKWKDLQADLEAQGFVCELRGKLGGRVRKP